MLQAIRSSEPAAKKQRIETDFSQKNSKNKKSTLQTVVSKTWSVNVTFLLVRIASKQLKINSFVINDALG